MLREEEEEEEEEKKAEKTREEEDEEESEYREYRPAERGLQRACGLIFRTEVRLYCTS